MRVHSMDEPEKQPLLGKIERPIQDPTAWNRLRQWLRDVADSVRRGLGGQSF